MPIYFQTDVSFSDIYMNDNTWYAYPDSEDRKGGSDIIRELRNNFSAIPISVCKSHYEDGRWKDIDYDERIALLSSDLLKVQRVLNRGGLVCFYMAEWTEHLEKMKKDCPKIFEFAVEQSGSLFDAYPPKDIKLRKTEE
tara:strand:- start:2424 stop:2840 length:417 start_codon:yes stop_codon:yes gene_type:complete